METVSKLLLKGGKVVNADTSVCADVYCEDGKIVKIGENLEVGGDVRVIDVSGKILVPGKPLLASRSPFRWYRPTYPLPLAFCMYSE